MNCGYWLLDTNYPAETITNTEYYNQVREFAKAKGNSSFSKANKSGLYNKFFSLITVALTMAFIFIALSKLPKPPMTSEPNTQPAQKTASPMMPSSVSPIMELEIIQVTTPTENNVRYVVGSVKNNSRRQYKNVHLEIVFYNVTGDQIGTISTNTNNLDPEEQWNFKVPIIANTATRFTINVKGY